MDLNEILRKNLVVVNGGSGVVLRSSVDETTLFVLTAKHVVSERGKSKIPTTVVDVLKRFGPIEVSQKDIWLHPDELVDAAVILLEIDGMDSLPMIASHAPTCDGPIGSVRVAGFPKLRRGEEYRVRHNRIDIKGSANENPLLWEADVEKSAIYEEMEGISGGGVFVIRDSDKVALMGIQVKMVSAEENLGAIDFIPTEQFRACCMSDFQVHFPEMEELVLSNTTRQTPTGNLSPLESDTIELCKNQIEKGEIESAIKALENLKENYWNEISRNDHYKLLVNLAVAHFKFGTKEGSESGARYLTQLEGFADIKDGAKGNAALGYAHLGDYEKALKLADEGKRIRDSQENAWLAEIFSFRNHSQLASVSEKLPNKLRESSYFLSNVGIAFYRFGDRNAAIYWLRESLDKCSNDQEAIQIKLFLGSTLIERNAKPSDFMLVQFTQAAIREVKEGVELLEYVWKQWRGTAWARIRKRVLQNLSIGKKIMGDMEGALASLRECYELDESDGEAKSLYGIALFDNDKWDEAAEAIESLKGTQFETPDLLLVLSEMNLNRGRGDLSIRDLETLIENIPAELSGQKQLHPYILLFKCYLQADKLEKAREILNKFEDFAPGNVNIYVLRGDLSKEEGDPVKAIVHYLEATTLVDTGTSYVVISNLGDRLFSLGEFLKAAEVYKLVVNPLVSSEVNQKFIESLYNSDNKSQALEICRGLEDRLGKGEFLTSIEANLNEQAGNLAEAIKVCSDYLSANPNSLEISLYLTHLYIRSGELEKAKHNFSGISHEKIDLSPPRTRLSFAQLAVDLGKISEGMEILFSLWYESRDSEVFQNIFLHNYLKVQENKNEPSAFSQNSKILRGYVSILREVSTEEEIHVYLKEGSQKVITDFGYECGYDSDWGMILIGEHLKNNIELDFGTSKRIFEISGIHHKCVWAFNKIYHALVADPSKGGGITVIDLGETENGEPNIQKFLDIICELEQQKKRSYDLYRQHPYPISALARNSRQNVFQTMDFLSHSDGDSIISYHPNQSPGPSQQELDEKDLILDLVAIYTIDLLGIEKEVLQAFRGRLGITQATLDEIRSMEEQVIPGMATIGTNEKEENIWIELSEEWIKSEKERFQSLFQWCKQNLKVFPVESALNARKQFEQPYYEILPQSSLHTLWVATEEDLILVSDDMIFRGAAFELNQTKGISVIEMLWLLVRDEKVSKEALTVHLTTLIARNYRYPMVDNTVLWKALEMSHFQNDWPFSKTVRSLSSDYLTESHALGTVLRFFRELVLSLPVSPQRDSIVAETLKWLVVGRNPKKVLGLLLWYIRHVPEFRFLPEHERELSTYIALWGQEVLGL